MHPTFSLRIHHHGQVAQMQGLEVSVGQDQSVFKAHSDFLPITTQDFLLGVNLLDNLGIPVILLPAEFLQEAVIFITRRLFLERRV